MDAKNVEDLSKRLDSLLPHGAKRRIANQIGRSEQSVGRALKRAVEKPGHPAVIAAVKIIEDSGAVAASLILAGLTTAPAQ